jgi:TRAP-type C4-dicarboxylate transport system substrate-binding protein
MRRRSTGCSVVLMRTLLRAALPLGGSLVLVGCSGAVDKAGGKPKPAPRKATVLSLAIRADPWEVNGLAERVNRLSHGTLRIVVKPRWRYGQAMYASALIDDVRAGRADLGAAEASAWDAVGVSSFRALGAPLLIDSYALQAQVLESSMIPEMLRGLRPLGLVGIGVLPGQLPRPLGVRRPLLGRSDFAGARIGVQQSLVGDETLRMLGARPQWIAGGAPIAGLDGIAEPISWIDGGGYDRVAKYLTRNLVLWARPIVLFANTAAFARLTALQRRALEQAVSDDVTGQTRVILVFERYSAGVLCADRRLRFAAATPTDLALLRRAMRPAYEQLERNPQARSFITQITALRARLRAPSSVVPSCGSPLSVSFAAPGAATLLDGVYAVNVAPRDLRPSQRLPEGYGSWQIVLDRGRFRFTARSDQANWFADGLVRVSGDEMSWTVADADGSAPDGVPLRNGERLRFRWRRRGAALTLVSDAKPVLAALVVRPLVRVGDAPGQQPLENPAAIQGTWVTNVTAADEIAHGGHKEDIPDNTGLLRLTVRGSHCRWTQHTPDGVSSAVGICRFAGDTFEFDRTPRSDSIPTFLDWSVYHGRLTLREAPGFSPSEWTFHPWRKVS